MDRNISMNYFIGNSNQQVTLLELRILKPMYMGSSQGIAIKQSMIGSWTSVPVESAMMVSKN